ncbi:Methyltransferase domain-containing protein [Filimonas lacunae]|uniref:Methyltransferase domain-containing protein n=1 Tax=Filimonas lacunae TaxID=477680 RepID=A0A173MLQ4_9BACT|nr:class I SAM-dependent methyltransferase [Filimonas lacunae]BAV08573.1 methyltransferase [Filimonas lacunae]SIS57420.1 Methyltransferase domain-containing protein [Filimonas lacunae]
MFEFHGDRKRYFDIQVANAEQYVIPFIEESFPIKPGTRVLEIGCGEGGVLKAFINRGCTGVGVELYEERVLNGMQWLKEDLEKGSIRFVTKDIYKADVEQDLGGSFDIIVLKDVIEHIHDQPRLIGWMKTFLSPGGKIFFGFPPWQMPFGGHQQMCINKVLSKLPWYHLLPTPIYRFLLNRFSPAAEESLLEIKETGISIERFERIVKQQGYAITHKTFYLLNPIYKWKFGWEGIKQLPVIKSIPYVRNFVTTCVYYLISAN